MRKCLIFALVGVGQLVDTYIVGQGSVLRTAIIFFYLSNEGLSLVENAAHLGLLVPEQLKDVLVQLHRKAEEDGPVGVLEGDRDADADECMDTGAGEDIDAGEDKNASADRDAVKEDDDGYDEQG